MRKARLGMDIGALGGRALTLVVAGIAEPRQVDLGGGVVDVEIGRVGLAQVGAVALELRQVFCDVGERPLIIGGIGFGGGIIREGGPRCGAKASASGTRCCRACR
jgi:hypothetical protein